MKQLLATAGLMLGLAACGNPAPPAEPAAPAETRAAAPEGEAPAGTLNVYSARHYDSDKAMYAAFEAQTGIRVNVRESGAPELLETMRAEGARSPADVIIASDAGALYRFQAAGFTQGVTSDTLSAAIPERLREKDGHWFGLTKRYRVIVYDPQVVSTEEVDTYADLADPRLMGEVCVRSSTNIYNLSLMGEFIGAGITLPVLMPLMDDSWRATLLAWSLPALLVAAALFLPRREMARPVKKPAWLPDWKNPLTLRIGLLLGLSGSLFFGLNAYMGNILEQQGNFDMLADALFWYNFAQVIASLVMLKMARYWVGLKGPIMVMATCSILGTVGTVVFTGWWSIASATFMSFTAGILLILLVALPPVLVESRETGRLSAGNFLVGYTVAFSVPMIGGLLADWGNDARYAIIFIIAYCALVLPLTFTLNLKRQKGQPES